MNTPSDPIATVSKWPWYTGSNANPSLAIQQKPPGLMIDAIDLMCRIATDHRVRLSTGASPGWALEIDWERPQTQLIGSVEFSLNPWDSWQASHDGDKFVGYSSFHRLSHLISGLIYTERPIPTTLSRPSKSLANALSNGSEIDLGILAWLSEWYA